jgi:hypothetical protein
MVQPRPLLADANANAFDGDEPGEFYLDMSITTPVQVRPRVWAAWNRSIHRAPLRRLPVIGCARMSSAALMRRALSRVSCHLHQRPCSEATPAPGLGSTAPPASPRRGSRLPHLPGTGHVCAGTDVARCMTCRLWFHSQCAARSMAVPPLQGVPKEVDFQLNPHRDTAEVPAAYPQGYPLSTAKCPRRSVRSAHSAHSSVHAEHARRT